MAQGDSLTRSQRLLLTAALADHGTALAAWTEWCRDFRLDDAGQETFWILPLIYRQLESGGFDGPEHGRLKGIYKQTRLRSAVLRPKLLALIEEFDREGIDAGASSLSRALLEDENSALPLEPAVLVCAPDCADSCHRVLAGNGWQAERRIPRTDMRAFIGAVTYLQPPLGAVRLVWAGPAIRHAIMSVIAWQLEHPGEDWRTAPVQQPDMPPADRLQRLRWHRRRYQAADSGQRPASFLSYLYAWHRYFQ